MSFLLSTPQDISSRRSLLRNKLTPKNDDPARPNLTLVKSQTGVDSNTQEKAVNAQSITCKDRVEDSSSLWGSGRQTNRKSSAVQRHFAQFERHQLQEVNDEIESGWNCGVCEKTAEDPCVTRCGHLFCRSHITKWLLTNLSCPVCESFCTTSQDVVPVFARDESSSLLPSSFSSGISSPPLSPMSISPAPQADISAKITPGSDKMPYKSCPSTLPDSPPDSEQPQDSPTPPQSFLSHIFVHYFGTALRVLGLGILLAALLPGGLFTATSSADPSTT